MWCGYVAGVGTSDQAECHSVLGFPSSAAVAGPSVAGSSLETSVILIRDCGTIPGGSRVASAVVVARPPVADSGYLPSGVPVGGVTAKTVVTLVPAATDAWVAGVVASTVHPAGA